MGWHCQKCKHWIVDDWDTCTYCGASRYGSYSPTSHGGYSYPTKRSNKIVRLIIIIAIILGITYALTSTNILNQATSLLAEIGKNVNTSNSAYLMTTQISQTGSSSVNVSGNLIFCVNRMVFRTSDSRGLNSSQVQELVNYCQYYNYQPGVVNGTNYTPICQGVKSCGG